MKKLKRLSMRKKKKSECEDDSEAFNKSKSVPEASYSTKEISRNSYSQQNCETSISTIPKVVFTDTIHSPEVRDSHLMKEGTIQSQNINTNASNNETLSGRDAENTLRTTHRFQSLSAKDIWARNTESTAFNFQPCEDDNDLESSHASKNEACNGEDEASKSPESSSLLTAHAIYQSTLIREFKRLALQGWYWGPLTRTEAEEKLANLSDGSFLVRDSSDERYLWSLSFRSFGRSLHTRIEHSNGRFSFYADGGCQSYTSVVDLIEDSVRDSQHSGVFCYSRNRMPQSPTLPVRLTNPVSRLSQVRTLQYLCRFVIRQYTRIDHIQELPLPDLMKGYVNQSYF